MSIVPTRLAIPFLPQLLDPLLPQLLDPSLPQLLDPLLPQLLDSQLPQLLDSQLPQLLISTAPLGRVDPKLFVFTFRHFPATKKLTKNRDKFFLDGNSTRKPFSRVLEALAVCLVCYRASKKGHFEVFQTKMKGGC